MEISGFQESRTRVTLFLPVKNAREEHAVRAVIGYLKSNFIGCTHSLLVDPVFRGHWFSEEDNAWIPDPIAVFVMDYKNDLEEQELQKEIGQLRTVIQESYQQYAARIRDKHGVVVNREALMEAAFEEAKRSIRSDVIFSGYEEVLEGLELVREP